MIGEIDRCRACGNRALVPVLGLGDLHLPGTFPADAAASPSQVPVELVRCDGAPPNACGLVQLRHRIDAPEMRAPGYGERPARHPASARHLAGIAERLRRHVRLDHHDVVLDIGSGDGALLSAFEPGGPLLIGIDPAAGRHRRRYRADIQVLPQPFSNDAVRKHLGGKKVKIVTAIDVLHGLDDPLAFLKDVGRVLDEEGIACLEQVYLPAILKQNAHDALRPEHATYFSVRQLLWAAEQVGLKVIDVLVNDAEGGSIAVTFARVRSPRGRPPSSLGWYLENEAARGFDDPETWSLFQRRMSEQNRRLVALLDDLRAAGERVIGWGATPAGNVLLERCGIGPDRLPSIASADPDCVGLRTPGTGIPIISEADARARNPEYFLAPCSQFREDVLRSLNAYLLGGGKVIFPTPEVEIVTA